MGLTLRRKRGSRPDLRRLIVEQIDCVIEGAEVSLAACSTEGARSKARQQMRSIEHAGDRCRKRVIERMGKSLTTHLEREDIFRASRSIDDVLDNLRDFVRELTLWNVPASSALIRAIEPVGASLRALRVGAAETDFGQARDKCLEGRKLAGTIRRQYQEGLAELFSGELTMDTIKTRESVRRLDVVGLRLMEAADAVLDGLVKRSL